MREKRWGLSQLCGAPLVCGCGRFDISGAFSTQGLVTDGAGKLSCSLHSPVGPSQESLPLCLCLSSFSSSSPPPPRSIFSVVSHTRSSCSRFSSSGLFFLLFCQTRSPFMLVLGFFDMSGELAEWCNESRWQEVKGGQEKVMWLEALRPRVGDNWSDDDVRRRAGD